ncbi:Circadian clock-controlled protein, partial [Dufourea novaeangliae]
STVKTCKKDADDFSSCLRLAIQESWPTFMEGLPDFEIPPLDPYYIETHSMNYNNGQMRGAMSASDAHIYGLSNARFLSVKPELSDDFFRLEVDVEFPKLLLDGYYKADGNLGSFKIGGKGFFNVSMGDVRTTWDISGHVTDDRWVVEHFKFVPEVGDMKIWFNGLFNGNEEMNKAALYFVNEYWPMVYRSLLPKLMEAWDTDLTEFVNRFFSKIPFSAVFP